MQSGYMTSSKAADSVSDSAALASTTNIQQYRSRKERAEFKELLFVAEQYLGKTLSATDIDQITYFYDTLNMSAELIEYLIEYCVENGHKSMHYINKVALSWHEENITTVNLAKTSSFLYNKNCYCVLMHMVSKDAVLLLLRLLISASGQKNMDSLWRSSLKPATAR